MVVIGRGAPTGEDDAVCDSNCANVDLAVIRRTAETVKRNSAGRFHYGKS